MTSDADRLDELEKGDRFRVDCHDETLRVHCAGPYGGPIVCDAYDENGAQWPVAEVNGQLYLGWSQVTPADEQTRAKEIGSVTIVDGASEIRADGGVDQLDTDRLQELFESIHEVRDWAVACKAKQDQLAWEARQEDEEVRAARFGGRREVYYTVEEVLVESVLPHLEELAEGEPALSLPENDGSDGGDRDD